MSQHEEYTMPPGLRVSGGSGGASKLVPVLLDPTTPSAIGDTLVYDGTKYVPQAPSVRVATVPISSVELLDLHTTPKVLVAAPGPGKVTMLLWVIYRFTGGAVAYTFDPATVLRLGYAPDPGVLEITEFGLQGIFDQTNIDYLQNQATTIGGDYAALGNQPVVAQVDSALTLGNGTLAIVAGYTVV